MNAWAAYQALGDCRGGWPLVLANDIVGRYVYVDRLSVQRINGRTVVVIDAGEDMT